MEIYYVLMYLVMAKPPVFGRVGMLIVAVRIHLLINGYYKEEPMVNLIYLMESLYILLDLALVIHKVPAQQFKSVKLTRLALPKLLGHMLLKLVSIGVGQLLYN